MGPKAKQEQHVICHKTAASCIADASITPLSLSMLHKRLNEGKWCNRMATCCWVKARMIAVSWFELFITPHHCTAL
jgi:hypothetical protein